jgi:hypothetical protein
MVDQALLVLADRATYQTFGLAQQIQSLELAADLPTPAEL